MIIETEIRIGDIVELSPTKMSTLDDLDLEVGTVLEINEQEHCYKIVFNNDTYINERFFDNNSTSDWFSLQHIINVERDYKVINITDNQDTITGQEVCIITMAKVKKQVELTEQGYTITAVVDEFDTDKFIFAGFTANELSELQDTYSRVSFAQYKLRDAEIDYVPIKGWQSKTPINEPGDIFTLLDLGYSEADN
ncbi:MAG: hypothetical protein ABIN91_12900 [Mucilaginibacter sp.]|uniref:hypothetical protein n=1 Tax=Mucilaginibacter sp. TaxID=1882438 RepID=UPI003263A9E6